MITFILGLVTGFMVALFVLALCKAAGRCPYQDDTGTCEFARKYEMKGDLE